MSNKANALEVAADLVMSDHRRLAAPIGDETLPVMWTAREVARCARCSVRHVGHLRQMGLPCLKIGHMVRFEPQRVIAWMQAHLEHGGSAAATGGLVK